MNRISRKDFIRLSALSSAALPLMGYGCAWKRGESGSGETLTEGSMTYADALGFQVFTLREALTENASGLFRSLSEAGIKNIEFFNPATLNSYVPIVKDNGMHPLATHFMPGYISGNWETATAMGMPPPEHYGFDNILADCQANGVQYAGIAIMLQEERESLDHYRRFADEANKKAEQAKEAGVQLYYHNHNFEFEPVDGTTPYEEMLKIFDPELVKLEVDVFWLTMAGQNPLTWLQRIADRLLFLHMKDLKKDAQTGTYDIYIPDDHFVELGTGMLDWNAILTEARNLGVKYAIIDQDRTQMEDGMESVRMNVNYIRSLGI